MWYEKLQNLKWEDAFVMMGLVMLIAGVGMILKGNFDKEEVAEVIKADIQVDSEVMIDIAGEVVKPGVYKLAGGSRVNDALIAAGGLEAEADRDWVESKLNKADKLRDGQKIYIPKKAVSVLGVEETGVGERRASIDTTQSVISLNQATAEELEKLPGIGPVTAAKIIKYREENGGFKNAEELKLVSGIGEKMYGEIKDLVGL